MVLRFRLATERLVCSEGVMATPNIGGRPTGRPVGSWLFRPQSLHRQRWEPFFLPLRTVRPLPQ